VIEHPSSPLSSEAAEDRPAASQAARNADRDQTPERAIEARSFGDLGRLVLRRAAARICAGERLATDRALPSQEERA